MKDGKETLLHDFAAAVGNVHARSTGDGRLFASNPLTPEVFAIREAVRQSGTVRVSGRDRAASVHGIDKFAVTAGQIKKANTIGRIFGAKQRNRAGRK